MARPPLRMLPALFHCALPEAAAAHPPMFVQTAVALRFDSGGLASGIRVSWAYDSHTTLQVLTDHGLEEDGNGQRSTARIDGFAMSRHRGYRGDRCARLDRRPLHLSGPRDRSPADTAKAKADLKVQLRLLPSDPEMSFPAVGKELAAEARVICAPGS